MKSLLKLINGNSVLTEGRKDPQPNLNCYWQHLRHCCYEVRASLWLRCNMCARLDHPQVFLFIYFLFRFTLSSFFSKTQSAFACLYSKLCARYRSPMVSTSTCVWKTLACYWRGANKISFPIVFCFQPDLLLHNKLGYRVSAFRLVPELFFFLILLLLHHSMCS
jgi:hypothetical protein